MNPRAPVLSLTLPLLLWGCGSTDGDAAVRADIAVVKRGELRIIVTETANIRAARETRVKCQMEGKSTIIWLIDEGKNVKQGDKLVELDASNQIERRAQQEITVERSEASVVNAQKDLEILEKQIVADCQAAQNNLLFAKMDQEKFFGKVLSDGTREMGEREQSIQAEEEQIKIVQAELKLAKDKWEASIRLREQDFITENELDRNKLEYDSKQTKLILARNRLQILKDYTHKKSRLELEQKVTDAGLELERTQARCEARLIQAQADLKSKRAELTLATERLDNLKKQIENSVVRAPTPGIVVYAYEGDWRRRQYIEEGATVRERQNLVILPDTTRMIAELRVHEAMANKVEPGQRALIEVDTLERALTGRVIRRSPLPDSTSRWGNPDLKVYKTEIEIDGDNADMALRPGMSGTAKILIERLPNVLYIPQQAVERQGAVNFVWLKTRSGTVAKQVRLGTSNNTEIVVLSGLEEGQQVYLAKPPAAEEPEFPQPEQVLPRIGEGPGEGPDVAQVPGPDGEDGVNGKDDQVANRGADTDGGIGQANDAAASRPPGDGSRGERPRSGQPPSPTYQAFLNLLKQKLSAADHAKVEANRFAAFTDAGIREQIQNDPELKAAWDKVMAEFRSRRSNRGDGEDRGGRERGGRGRGGRGRGPGGGNR